jgi:hypothetical protein
MLAPAFFPAACTRVQLPRNSHEQTGIAAGMRSTNQTTADVRRSAKSRKLLDFLSLKTYN